MAQIATKFVQWDVPELATLQGSRVYKLREHLNNGGKLNREDKNWITRNVSESTYFKRGIALSGYHFDFSDVLKRYFVKQYGHIQEYYAIDKTALRVEANSYEEAEAIVRSWRCKDVSNIIDSRLSHGRSEALRDTSELLFPEENDGYSTIEIFNQEGESIMTNALNEDNYERND